MGGPGPKGGSRRRRSDLTLLLTLNVDNKICSCTIHVTIEGSEPDDMGGKGARLPEGPVGAATDMGGKGPPEGPPIMPPFMGGSGVL